MGLKEALSIYLKQEAARNSFFIVEDVQVRGRVQVFCERTAD